MSESRPRISVVLTTFRSGPWLDDLIAALDAQTLPTERFEVVAVDDGSGDGTFDRLQAYARTRPWFHPVEIPPSGWAGRPRNVGTDAARGDYVHYLDHDDSLYPDALQRVADYADETHADVIVVRENRVNDPWWGLSITADGDVTEDAPRLQRLTPMVPHKFYRRSFLVDHGIRFLEEPESYWEDSYFNLSVFGHHPRIAVLASAPIYLWRGNDDHIAQRVQSDGGRYWECLDALFRHAIDCLNAPDQAGDLRAFLTDRYKGWVIGRGLKGLSEVPAELADAMVERARAAHRAWFDAVELEPWDYKHLAFAHLLEHGSTAEIVAFDRAIRAVRGSAMAHRIRWSGPVLRIELETTLSGGESSPFVRQAGDVSHALADGLARALPDDLTVLDERVGEPEVEAILYCRATSTSWRLPYKSTSVSFVDTADGVQAVARGVVEIATTAPEFAGSGDEWTLHSRVKWLGTGRKSVPVAGDLPVPGLISGQTIIVRADGRSRRLGLTGGPELPAFLKAGHPKVGSAAGTVRRLRIPLTTHTSGLSDIGVDKLFVKRLDRIGRAAERHRLGRLLRGVTRPRLRWRLIGNARGAALVGRGLIAPGRYRLILDGDPQTPLPWIVQVRGNGRAVLRAAKRR